MGESSQHGDDGLTQKQVRTRVAGGPVHHRNAYFERVGESLSSLEV